MISEQEWRKLGAIKCIIISFGYDLLMVFKFVEVSRFKMSSSNPNIKLCH